MMAKTAPRLAPVGLIKFRDENDKSCQRPLVDKAAFSNSHRRAVMCKWVPDTKDFLLYLKHNKPTIDSRTMRSKIIISAIIIIMFLLSISQIFHKNKGESISRGEYSNGSLENAYLLPLKSDNWKCYSWLSYFILDREYVHSKLYRTIEETYTQLSNQYPERTFIYMESARKRGGRLFPHRTHQNGLSIDFMSPMNKKNGDPKYFNAYGIFRYALNFDNDGRLSSNSDISIDFDVLANHILLLNKNAGKNGLRIKKVILKIDLKDNLFNTKMGQQLKNSGIYFAQNLTPTLNKLHDDHYHVDFEIIGH